MNVNKKDKGGLLEIQLRAILEGTLQRWMTTIRDIFARIALPPRQTGLQPLKCSRISISQKILKSHFSPDKRSNFKMNFNIAKESSFAKND